MNATTGIEWTDATSNPVKYRDKATGAIVWACVKHSPGCAHCYAETLAKRYGRGGPFTKAEMAKVEPFVCPEELCQILRSPKLTGKKCFVGDMTDVLGDWVTDDMLDTLLAALALRLDATLQVLTKRADRLAEYMRAPDRKQRIAARTMDLSNMLATRFRSHTARLKLDDMSAAFKGSGPLRNIWFGVSVENQKAADERIPLLLQTPAAVRFLSVEPLIEDVGRLDLLRLETGNPAQCVCGHGHGFTRCPNTGGIARSCHRPGCECPGFRRRPGSWTGIDWVIVGGESGPGARPMHPDWARSLRDQCQAAGVSYFFKQWGEWAPLENHRVMVPSGNYALTPSGETVTEHDKRPLHIWPATEIDNDDSFSAIRVGKKAAGRLLDGREWNEFPTEVK